MENVTPATTPTASADFVAAPQPHEVTLEQFAIELSMRDPRVGLVNGFVFTERQAGNFKALPSAYQARFNAFVDQPA